MADEIDMAQNQIDQFLTAAIATRRIAPVLVGKCNYCGEVCDGRFCDTDCHADYEREQKINRINGRL